MVYIFNRGKASRGGKHCVAGSPKLSSCANDSKTEGISMHQFPNEETDAQRRNKWVKFVHKPRVFVQPTSKIRAMI